MTVAFLELINKYYFGADINVCLIDYRVQSTDETTVHTYLYAGRIIGGTNERCCPLKNVRYRFFLHVRVLHYSQYIQGFWYSSSVEVQHGSPWLLRTPMQSSTAAVCTVVQ